MKYLKKGVLKYFKIFFNISEWNNSLCISNPQNRFCTRIHSSGLYTYSIQSQLSQVGFSSSNRSS